MQINPKEHPEAKNRTRKGKKESEKVLKKVTKNHPKKDAARAQELPKKEEYPIPTKC